MRLQVLSREWLPTDDAAQLLGKSDRSLLRLAKAGEVRWRTADGGRQREYHAGDILRAKEQATPASREEPQRALATRATATLALSPDTTALFEQAAARFKEAAALPRVVEKIWLTLEEAQAYSGRSRAFLLRACRESQVKAVKDGGWRIRRTSLERL